MSDAKGYNCAIAEEVFNRMVFTVHMTGKELEGYTVDKTLAEILEAHNAGKIVRLVRESDNACFNLVEVNKTYAQFGIFFGWTGSFVMALVYSNGTVYSETLKYTHN